MPPPPTFEVEKWMDEHEMTAKYQLAETCCASISVQELLSFSQTPLETGNVLDSGAPQTYGEIRGDKTLRSNLAALYSARSSIPFSPEKILITPGAIAANHLVFYSLIKPGDHVVCQHPTYQQLYAVPASLGAEVSLWKPKRERDSWWWDVNNLKAMLKPETKMIILNNPNNPTGAILSKQRLQDIAELARERNIIILSDEVYRPVFHSITPADDEFPPSILNVAGISDSVIATGSLSKAYALAGIRIGWIATRSTELLEQMAATRHYTAISVSRLDQGVASAATSQLCLHGLLVRNIELAKTNLRLLENFVNDFKSRGWCDWVRPVAGTTAFVKFQRDGKPIDDVVFCERLQQETGVMVLPGSRGFGDDTEWKGYVRVGYVNHTEEVQAGLEKTTAWMKEHFESLPTVEE